MKDTLLPRKTYNDILTNLSFAEDSTVRDTAKFFVDECKEDLKKVSRSEKEFKCLFRRQL